MTELEINKILKRYKESYAPWEMDAGNCVPYEEDRIVEFGKQIYNQALEDAESNVKLKKEPVTDSVGNVYEYQIDIDKESILKLKI